MGSPNRAGYHNNCPNCGFIMHGFRYTEVNNSISDASARMPAHKLEPSYSALNEDEVRGREPTRFLPLFVYWIP